MMLIDSGPVTRIEGHLNIKSRVKDNLIVDAMAMGQIYRGIESILRGRSPLDAQQISQRICGACSCSHAIASIIAQNNACGIQLPPNGQIIHNLVHGMTHLYDYLIHFYQSAAPDFIDVTTILAYQGKDPDLQGIKSWIKSEMKSRKNSPAAPFLPRLAGRYIENRDVSGTVLKHYIEALDIGRKAGMACAVLGGRFPHPTAVFPGGSVKPVSVEQIIQYRSLLNDVRSFIHNAYLPDLISVAGEFSEYWNAGKSRGGFLSFGIPASGRGTNTDFLFSPGALTANYMSSVDHNKITENISFSRFSSSVGNDAGTGYSTNPEKKGAYTWIKAPRYGTFPMETGPAARILVDFHQKGNPEIRNWFDKIAHRLDIFTTDLNSVMGRHLSRGICAAVIADFLLRELENLEPDKPVRMKNNIPESCEGTGTVESSRGALLHQIRVKNFKIVHYNCISPSTWNLSPLDNYQIHGPLESALIGAYVRNPEEQLEAGRIIRSFAPCPSCAAH